MLRKFLKICYFRWHDALRINANRLRLNVSSSICTRCMSIQKYKHVKLLLQIFALSRICNAFQDIRRPSLPPMLDLRLQAWYSWTASTLRRSQITTWTSCLWRQLSATRYNFFVGHCRLGKLWRIVLCFVVANASGRSTFEYFLWIDRFGRVCRRGRWCSLVQASRGRNAADLN